MWDSIYQTLKNRSASPMGHQILRESAVLVPLVEQEGVIRVLFEERAHHMRHQPGEICFPGGRIDPTDRDPQSAAIRETCEELGIRPEQIEPIGKLNFLVTQSQIIYPTVGRILAPDMLRPSPAEVASVFSVPLNELLQMTPEIHLVDLQVKPREDFPFHQISKGRDYNWRKGTIPQYFYTYEDRVIWGLTARVLAHFLELLRSEKK